MGEKLAMFYPPIPKIYILQGTKVSAIGKVHFFTICDIIQKLINTNF